MKQEPLEPEWKHNLTDRVEESNYLLAAESLIDGGARLVFIIGAGRSGTTLLADLVGAQPGFHNLMEKRYLWMYHAYWRGHDIRQAAEVTPAVRAHISQYLAGRMRSTRCQFLVEKTPSNCFRISFLRQLYPRARFIHIIRDGRAVAYSSVRAFLGEGTVTDGDRRSGRRSMLQRLAWLAQRWPEVPRRLAEGDLPLSGWLPYLTRKSVEMVQTLVSRKPAVWGARYPGIYADRDAYSPLQVAGIQWRESVSHALAGLERWVVPEQRMTVVYEQFIERPRAVLQSVVDFLGQRTDASWLENSVAQVRGDDARWRSGLTDDERAELYPHIVPMLLRLGYLTTPIACTESKEPQPSPLV